MWSRLFLCLICVTLVRGCGRTRYTSLSPDGRHVVSLSELCLGFDCAVTVKLTDTWSSTRVLDERSDCLVDFAHVA